MLDAIEAQRTFGTAAAVGQLAALRTTITIDLADMPRAIAVAEAALRELPGRHCGH